MNVRALASTVMLTLLLSPAELCLAQSMAPADPTDAGKAVFKRANCFGCHKWHGNGGGGYGGDALSLRKTDLDRAQLVETVTCGRPGTGMPYFARGSYDTSKCYAMSRTDVGDRIPPEGASLLRPSDIEAVADYVLVKLKGKGEPTHDECIAFFGSTSRVCDVYRTNASSVSDTKSKSESAR